MTVSRQHLHPGGPELSRLVWGAWRSVASPETDTPAKLARLIEGCLELGITSFDHADIYGGYRAEAHFGAALREWDGERGAIELITKCDIALVNPARPTPSGQALRHRCCPHPRFARVLAARSSGPTMSTCCCCIGPTRCSNADETARALEERGPAGKTLQSASRTTLRRRSICCNRGSRSRW